MKAACSVDGCSRPVAARGWCTTHYSRWHRHDSPNAEVRAIRPGATCDAAGCVGEHHALGLCRHHYGKSRDAIANRAYRDRIHAIKLAAGCADCGYNAHPEALEFDHRPGEKKVFAVGEAATRAWPKVEAEIAKCEVVCANCHRVRTANRRAA